MYTVAILPHCYCALQPVAWHDTATPAKSRCYLPRPAPWEDSSQGSRRGRRKMQWSDNSAFLVPCSLRKCRDDVISEVIGTEIEQAIASRGKARQRVDARASTSCTGIWKCFKPVGAAVAEHLRVVFRGRVGLRVRLARAEGATP